MNRADYEALLRVPGVGVKSARLINQLAPLHADTVAAADRRLGDEEGAVFRPLRELTAGQGANELRPEQVRRLLTAPKRQKPG